MVFLSDFYGGAGYGVLRTPEGLFLRWAQNSDGQEAEADGGNKHLVDR